MAADPMSRHYAALTAPERFALVVEAMARRDSAEADRLEDTCPRLTYRMEDAESATGSGGRTRSPPWCA